MRRIGVEERRARLALRHHLAAEARANDPIQVARSLVGLHATDPATVFLAAAVRMRGGDLATIEGALYRERALVRILGMRRTMFVLPVDLATVVQAACAASIADRERRRLIQLLQGTGLADAEVWLAEVEAATLRALEARGEATAAELVEDEPRLGRRILMAEGKPYQAWQGISTRVLLLLAAEGRIVRGRPSGSWTSTRYRWSPMATWLPDGGTEPPPADQARCALVRAWLGSFGPGTAEDVRWWTGLTASQVRSALARAGAVEVELDEAAGFVLADDLEPPAAPRPWAALLPALDPTVMGWSQRTWFVGGHAPALFDRSGNAGPTVWWEGRVVGGWAQRPDGEIVWRLLEDVGSEAATGVRSAAERLRPWLGELRVTPRFRTPLERELAG